MPAVVLHLRIAVAPEKREELLTFLRDARDYYQQPGGIRMRLLQDGEDENAFIEVFEYDTIEDYQKDEQRVAADPAMRAVLAKWRSLLKDGPKVEVCFDVTEAELGESEAGSQAGAADQMPADDDEG
jgi:quinol monooxygenase YgiN